MILRVYEGELVLFPQVGSDAYKMAPKDARFKSKEDFAYNTGNGYLGTFKRYGKLNSFRKKKKAFWLTIYA